jgi:hypothetical protein
MALPQSFPVADVPIVDSTGILNLTWLQFFIALWNRTGASAGNAAQLNFNYPSTAGAVGQVLTSEGLAVAAIWTTPATKLSQLTNDVGFLTTSSLSGYSTTAQTNTQIAAYVAGQEATSAPPADAAVGSAGTSSQIARADHFHPLPFAPSFSTSVTSPKLVAGTATWTSGNGAPGGLAPPGSIYSNVGGFAGGRLYVSSGAGWTAVPGV